MFPLKEADTIAVIVKTTEVNMKNMVEQDEACSVVLNHM